MTQNRQFFDRLTGIFPPKKSENLKMQMKLFE